SESHSESEDKSNTTNDNNNNYRSIDHHQQRNRKHETFKAYAATNGFSWVFFLASKKIIRCDNGTEFKNVDLNQFCGLKDAHRIEHDDDIQKSVSPDIHSLSSGSLTRKQCDKTKNKDKGKSHVVTITGFRDLNAEFEEYNNNSSNEVNVASSLVSNAGKNSIDITNDFSAAGPSNTTMPKLEDLSHDADDVGTEADINNLESIILVSHILTTRIHKDHPTS
nr:hypothetical protein [Tanacetum cinerariifolium]